MKRLTNRHLEALETAWRDIRRSDCSPHFWPGNSFDPAVQFMFMAHNALPALLAEVRALREAVRWRPLSEAHEDHGPVILIDIQDPGSQMISHVCAETWPDDIEGMTHFAKLPPLTNEEAEEMLAATPEEPCND